MAPGSACVLEAWDSAKWGSSPPSFSGSSGGSLGPQCLVLPLPLAVTLAESFTSLGLCFLICADASESSRPSLGYGMSYPCHHWGLGQPLALF